MCVSHAVQPPGGCFGTSDVLSVQQSQAVLQVLDAGRAVGIPQQSCWNFHNAVGMIAAR